MRYARGPVNRGLLTAALCLAVGACESNAKDEPAPAAATPAATTAGVSADKPAPDVKKPVSAVKAPKPAAAAAGAGPVFLATQLGHKMSEFSFLGWTSDGAQFALETVHGSYGWDREKDSRSNSDLQVMRMRIVYDTLTQRAVARFQLSNKLAKRDPLRKKLMPAWQEAKDKAAWKAWVVANPLTKSKPSTSSPDGAWKLTAKIDKRSIKKFTVISLKRRKGGFYTKWLLWQTNFPDDMDPVMVAMQSEGAGVTKPRLLVQSKKGKQAFSALRYHLPWSDDPQFWMGSDDNVVISGNLRPFWAPGGDRYLLAIFHKNSDDTMFPERREAAFFLRTPGPQIALRDGGAGMAAVRAQAAALAKAGFSVQQVSDAKAPVTETTVYYRGDGEATAVQVASKLGQSKIQKLSKKGWLDVVVVLGPR